MDALDHKSDGDMMFIVRNNYIAESVYKELIERGLPFASEVGQKAPLDKVHVRGALRCIANLRRGLAAMPGDFNDMLELVPHKIRDVVFLPRGAKTAARGNEQPVPLERAREEFGLTNWISVVFGEQPVERTLLKVGEAERGYLDSVLVKHPNANVQNEITLTNIHRSKGREANNIAILPDMSRRTYREFQDGDRESENRCAYVAATRVKDTLMLVSPEQEMFYNYREHARSV
jgi:superfamily I DNA/RNA helicase